MEAAGRTPSRWWLVAAGALLAGGALVLALALSRGGGDGEAKATPGLPLTQDYHSLLVSPSDPDELVLGTHDGLYVSADGGASWRHEALAGQDAMNLARPEGDTLWIAGHLVFKRSVDGGSTWEDVRPQGLPSLDIHGFAVDPRDPDTLYAAVAYEGFYRSTDGGRTFTLRSREVGAEVMGLAALPDGRVLAADTRRGLYESGDGGASWSLTIPAKFLGIAVDPHDPQRLLATGAGIALSTDGGRTWLAALDLAEGAGPVAWSESEPDLAYAVGFDRTLYRSEDGGVSWAPVEPAAGG